MKNIDKADDFKGLPLKYAYEYFISKGHENKWNEIDQIIDRMSRKAKIINFLEENKLLNEFINSYWPYAKTVDGKKKIKRYISRYNSVMEQAEIEDEVENSDDTKFAYEADLRDYLVKNLNIIEDGLKLYVGQNEIDGVEYSIDRENKRIDILAIDKNNIPVVIELKVSRGYERVIGQCLYYKNRVKELFNAEVVRIIIIAREISDQLKIATKGLENVDLYEYTLSVNVNKINNVL
jgi:hypothetical protein